MRVFVKDGFLARIAIVRIAIVLSMTAALASQPSVAQEANRKILSQKFERQLARIAEETPGVMGITVIDIDSGQRFGVNQDLLFPTASSIKLLIGAALYVQVSKGALTLDKTVPVDLGDGTREHSLREVSHRVLELSDNDATNALIDQVGMKNINDLAAQLGLKSMKFQRKMIQPKDQASGLENVSTPPDAAVFMVKLLKCELPMKPEVCNEMKRAFFKAYPAGPVRQQIPGDIPVMQMPGGLTGVRNSWAAVDLPGRPFALGIMGHYGDFERITESIREVADASYNYFRVLAGATDHGVRVGVDLIKKPGGAGSSHP